MDKNVFSDNKGGAWEVKENQIPLLSENHIAVCFASSDEYSPILGVALNSLISNISLDNKYDIVIIDKDITDNNKALLRSIVGNKENCTLRFFNVSERVKNYNFYTWAHFTMFTYYRLLVPSLFVEYEKVIYLDTDIVINSDIAELFSQNVKRYFLAAALDSHVTGRQCLGAEDSLYYRDELNCRIGEYFQAGVMLINVSMFKKYYKDDELIRKASEMKYRWLDQDFINVECHGKIKRLSNDWNVMVINNPNEVDENYLTDELYREYVSARNNPCIIHYVGRSIPCYKATADLYQYFWKYARSTPFYELLLARLVNETKKYLESEIVARYENLSQKIGNTEENIYARFKFPWKAVEPGAKIVIYGGGVVGKTFIAQLAKNPYCHVVAVCDKRPHQTGIQELPVITIEELSLLNQDSYDMVLIAIEKREIAINIRQDLNMAGISLAKVKWINPAKMA